MKPSFILIFFLLFFAACEKQNDSPIAEKPTPQVDSKPADTDHRVRVTAEEFGKKWAFTVNEGYVYSINNAAIFENRGRKFALNGIAMSQGYEDLDPIWKPDPQYSGFKVSVGPFIALALEGR